MTQSFAFHNVGQGLFYSGAIDNYKFIYDCGASKKYTQFLERSIVSYKNCTERINLLILSHLHYDHTSGLDLLLDDFEVGNVILPYFLPLERLAISLEDPRRPRWFLDFIADPVTFLFKKGVERVVLVGGNEGQYPEIPPSLYDYSEQEETNLEQMRDDESLIDVIKENDHQLKSLIGKKLMVKNHDGYVKALGNWFFRFFNYKVPAPQLAVFKKCVDQVFGPSYDPSEIIRSPFLTQLRKCYQRVQFSNDFNNTSLVAYHAPITSSNSQMTVQLDCSIPFCNFLQALTPSLCPISLTTNINSGAGQFLMGDINLNADFGQIERHYGSYFHDAAIIQIPHHGANKNWNSKILNNLNGGTFCVASAGTNNNYNHPDPSVIYDIRKNHSFLWCNEFSEINIHRCFRN